MPATAHAVFAPSSAKRWLNCRVSAVWAVDIDRRSDAADEGSRVHQVALENVIKHGIPVPESEPDEVHYASDLTRAYIAQLGEGALESEVRTTIVEGKCWGTIDLKHLPIVGNTWTLLDYKNGFLNVDVDDNDQLMTYAAGEFPKLSYQYENVRLVIIQPNTWRARDNPEFEVKQTVVSREKVMEHRARVERVVNDVGDIQPHPGSHCRFCPAFARCPAMMRYVYAADVNPREHSDDVLAGMLVAFKNLEDYRRALEEETMRRLTAGRAIPGARLGLTAPHRIWSNESEAGRLLFEAFGADAVKPVSPAQAEKLGAEGKKIAGIMARKPPGSPKVEIL